MADKKIAFCPEVLFAPDEPDESDIENVPGVFVHQRCGGRQEIPVAIVRSYLRDPSVFIGQTSSIHCDRCEKSVDAAECYWGMTGQNVREYRRLLIGESHMKSPFAPAFVLR